MIDIHSHVLPGLDDGARSLQEAVGMLQMAAAAGTTDIVATPHASPQFAFDAETAERSIGELQQAAGPLPRIHYGCEMHLTLENLEDALRLPARYTIAHHGYLLLEFPDTLIPKTAPQILEQLMAGGLHPVVAHPERNPLLQKRIAELQAWVEQGCLLQVTADSLLGRFGKTAREAGAALMTRGLVHFLASDGHDLRHRPPVLEQVRRHVEETWGEETARRLLVENPRALLEGYPLESTLTPARKKGWFALW